MPGLIKILPNWTYLSLNNLVIAVHQVTIA